MQRFLCLICSSRDGVASASLDKRCKDGGLAAAGHKLRLSRKSDCKTKVSEDSESYDLTPCVATNGLRRCVALLASLPTRA